MIDPKKFLKFLKKNKINLFCGVPDSCVAPFLEELKKEKNYVLANEGLAVSFAAGYYLATKKIALVYLQNSGLGNATDPLTNLTNKEVYKIPIVLLIGWRGHPQIEDEPQHILQGKIIKNTLKSFNIPNIEVKDKKSFLSIKKLISFCKKESRTVAILVNSKTFNKKKVKIKKNLNKKSNILRRDILEKILIRTKSDDKIVSSVGYNSREVYQICKNLNLDRKVFFLVGGLGHTSAVALAQNIFQKKRVICIDGDGSFIMHLGSLIHCGNLSNHRFKYIIFDNKSHESVGNIALNFKINYKKFSSSVGFKNFIEINKNTNIEKKLDLFFESKLNTFMLVKIANGTFKKLFRIKELHDIKTKFITD